MTERVTRKQLVAMLVDRNYTRTQTLRKDWRMDKNAIWRTGWHINTAIGWEYLGRTLSEAADHLQTRVACGFRHPTIDKES